MSPDNIRSRLLITSRLPLPKPIVSASELPSLSASCCAVTVSVATCTVFESSPVNNTAGADALCGSLVLSVTPVLTLLPGFSAIS